MGDGSGPVRKPASGLRVAEPSSGVSPDGPEGDRRWRRRERLPGGEPTGVELVELGRRAGVENGAAEVAAFLPTAKGSAVAVEHPGVRSHRSGQRNGQLRPPEQPAHPRSSRPTPPAQQPAISQYGNRLASSASAPRASPLPSPERPAPPPPPRTGLPIADTGSAHLGSRLACSSRALQRRHGRGVGNRDHARRGLAQRRAGGRRAAGHTGLGHGYGHGTYPHAPCNWSKERCRSPACRSKIGKSRCKERCKATFEEAGKYSQDQKTLTPLATAQLCMMTMTEELQAPSGIPFPPRRFLASFFIQ